MLLYQEALQIIRMACTSAYTVAQDSSTPHSGCFPPSSAHPYAHAGKQTCAAASDDSDKWHGLQVRSILGQTRPDRQTLLFSATMPGKVERLVRDALTSPVRVTVGEVGAANEDIKQARLVLGFRV